jgi:hypothetical protein
MKQELIQREFNSSRIVSILIFLFIFKITDVNEDGAGGEGDEFNIWR